MRAQQRRTIASLWPRTRFESFQDVIRHKEIRKRRGELSALRRLMLTPASPHSKTYGH
jgi:hypothetical protein